MELLAPAAAVALLGIPAIVALYLLKVRGPEVRVAGLFLWPLHQADRHANAPWKRLRPSWLLVVQLLVAATLALVLMRPGLVGASPPAATTVVLIDGSPSMRAIDVTPSRFEEAVRRAGEMVDELTDGQQMAVVVLGEHAELLTPPTDDRTILRDALAEAKPAGTAGNLDEGISVANALLTGQPGASMVLFGDGHAATPEAAPRVAAPFTYITVGQSTTNMAIQSLGRDERGDVFIAVANLGPEAEDRQIELRADGRLVDVVPVRVEGSSSAQPTWPRLPPGTGALEARLIPGDDLPIDDAAWLVTEASATRRVVLVTEGNGFLARALSLRDGVDLTVVSPEDYRPDGYALSVFDGFVPDGPLPQPALVVDPPVGTGPLAAGDDFDPGGLLPAEPQEPLLKNVSLRDVHVLSAKTVAPPGEWRTAMAATNGPLLLVHRTQPLAQLTFDLHDSDLPLRGAFPILVQNLLTYLLPGGFADQVLPLGQPVPITPGPEVTEVSVATPDGANLDFAPPYPTVLSDTGAPGVYAVTETTAETTSTRRFVVALQDPSQSQITPGEAPLVRETGSETGDAPRRTMELWPWLAALAIAGLTVEWLLYLRG